MLTSTKMIPVMLLSTSLLLYNTPKVFASYEPLLLTPYIQERNITIARQLSLVDDVEGIIPRSHAGFITVDKRLKNHLFFWYFPTLNSNTATPLLIWLNGGPGESSMIGLMQQNGPIELGKCSTTGETTHKKRNNTWVNKFYMLYIDNPIGTGYSYSESGQNGSRTTQDGFTQDLFEFIKQFYILFPELLQKDLYIGGESYAGKYVPGFAYKIHQEIQSGNSNITLKGIYLGAPLMDARVQLFIMFDAYEALGYITSTELEEFKKNLREKLPQSEGEPFVHDIIPLLYPITHDNVYTFDKSLDSEIKTVMTSDELRSLLHVGNLFYEAFNNNVFTSVVRDDLFVSSVSKLKTLMDNYKVLIYSGDMDGIVSTREIETVLRSLSWSLQAAYNSSRRDVWSSVDNTTVKGFYTRVSTFCRVVIRGAGHRVAYDQPNNTLEMMEKYVTNGCLG